MLVLCPQPVSAFPKWPKAVTAGLTLNPLKILAKHFVKVIVLTCLLTFVPAVFLPLVVKYLDHHLLPDVSYFFKDLEMLANNFI